LAEQEILREARRILARLAVARSLLVEVAGGAFAVTRNAAAAGASRVRLEGAMANAFHQRGWIGADGPGRFVIAQAGRDFLARASGENGFADQHRVMANRTDGEGAVRVNMGESPLARLAFKSLIDPVQLAAGEKLRRDFTLGQMMPRMGVDLSAPVSGARGGGENISDIALAARQRFTRAMAAAGPGLSDLLFDVCCHLVSLEAAEGARGWAKRSGRVVLMLALDRLASHYGLTVTAPSRGAIRAWSVEAAE
jgi:hypothetical protein